MTAYEIFEALVPRLRLREQTILPMIAQGLRAQDIAARLGISETVVCYDIQRIRFAFGLTMAELRTLWLIAWVRPDTPLEDLLPWAVIPVPPAAPRVERALFQLPVVIGRDYIERRLSAA
jgi:DNA-binding CsgD family transcriptional regulator